MIKCSTGIETHPQPKCKEINEINVLSVKEKWQFVTTFIGTLAETDFYFDHFSQSVFPLFIVGCKL